MSKQFWAGFIFCFLLLGFSQLWVTTFAILVMIIFGLSIAFSIAAYHYEKRIATLVEIKSRQKMHIRRFIDAYDALRKQGRIVLYEELIDENFRKRMKKKKKSNDTQRGDG